jgi:sec-independent protein translocase protein TatA
MGLPNIGPLELIIILAIALLIVGPGKLPELGSAFGRTIREFRKAQSDIGDATKLDTKAAPPPPTPNTLGSAAVEPNTLMADATPSAGESAPRGTPADPADRPA